jgi:hypothetical protein
MFSTTSTQNVRYIRYHVPYVGKVEADGMLRLIYGNFVPIERLHATFVRRK